MPVLDPLLALAADPAAAALLFDVDGTLAPIAAEPGSAAVPEATRAELVRLHARYGLVGCISGRPGADAARLVGVPGLTYVGEHGLELDPDAGRYAPALAELVESVSWPAERKPLTVSFHFRGVEDEQEAIRRLELIADEARAAGLVPRFGRKVLEVRPPVAADKGTAVRALLEQAGLRRALYAGDDTTDLDAFRALEGLDVAVRVAVDSSEAPPALLEEADVVVTGPAELLELLRSLP